MGKLLNQGPDLGEKVYVRNDPPMQVSEVSELCGEARSDVDRWLDKLGAHLQHERATDEHEREIKICEATRMLTFAVRHLWMTSGILARRRRDDSAASESLVKLDQAIELMDQSIDVVTDAARKERIRKRRELLTELRALREEPLAIGAPGQAL